MTNNSVYFPSIQIRSVELCRVRVVMAAVDSFQLLYREIARSCDCYVETLALVGACYTASRAVIFMRDCCRLIRLHFIPRLVYRRDLRKRYGEWAVICGMLKH